jgi:hypothetical protein
MTKRTLEHVRSDLADIQDMLVKQLIYVDMLHDIYNNAQADLEAHKQRCSELVEELARHMGVKI